MPVPESIKQLVERFERDLELYRSGAYKEAHLRQEFLNPFFEALGWDMQNNSGKSFYEREVIHEDTLEIRDEKKAPDYAFKVGKEHKFFVEAKKPFVNIETSLDPAYQLRRYAWHKSLPLGILTDFEEFAVYDCRFEPKYGDKASVARVMLISFKDYLERWDEISGIFSREAVGSGSFDKYAEAVKSKKGSIRIDEAFLADIEKWRDVLARNIAVREPDLSVRELNYAVQMTIDRIIFLRICEDRGIERDGQLREIMEGGNIYEGLVQLFQRADARYNSGLLHFKDEKEQSSHSDSFTLKLKIDDKALKEILEKMYPPSPYMFKEIPTEILGKIYEQFLGKVIRLTPSHQAKVEVKPEVKKAGGVFYTPTFIVSYIVINTLGKLLMGLTPKEAAKLRIIDPACGSGTFLLGAYQYLLDWHLIWHAEHDPEKWTTGKKPALYFSKDRYYLTDAKKKEILLNNIYGVDIDAQAVEVTKLSLLLKVLEDESNETIGSQLALFQERVLPDLGKNIKCGNSLIAPDYWDGQFEGNEGLGISDEEKAKVNAFDWKAAFPDVFAQGGFDAVIGNPPYRVITEENLLSYFNSHYKNQDSQNDLYMLFLERYDNLLKPNGLLGVIVSNTWLQSITLQNIRKYMTSHFSWLKVLHLPEKVFKAVVDTHVLIFQKSNTGIQNDDNIVVEIMEEEQARQYHTLSGNFIPKQGEPINIAANPLSQLLFKKLSVSTKQLQDLFSVFNGVKPFEIGKGKPPQTEKIAKEQPFVVEGKAPDKKWKPLLRGRMIRRYVNNWNSDYWILYGEWLAAPRDPAIFDAPKKIMVRQTGDSIIATIIEAGFIARNNTHIILPKNPDYQFEYLLGLMNSKLMDFAYSFINPEKGEALAEVKKKHVEQLPIRPINFSNPADKARHDKMVSLVERMLELHKRNPRAPQEKESLAGEIASVDRSIDELVYQLYGLSEEEIKIVEGK